MSHSQPHLFPLFANLRGRRVVVVGGGEVARRKIDALLEAGADVVVGAPVLVPVLQERVAARQLQHYPGRFSAQWLDDAWLVIAATDDPDINQAVVTAADQRRIWSNIVDDHVLSRVHVPARVVRGALQIAISTAGAAPMLARHLRQWLEQHLDPSLAALTTLLQDERPQIRTHLSDLQQRRHFFERLFRGPVLKLLRAGRPAAARTALRAQLHHTGNTPPAQGSVTLVGAGPGDPGLLTLGGLRALNQADVILYDHLVSDEVLALARRDAQRIDVGKHCGRHAITQDQIHALLLEHARAGKCVVRLKGGDPFVFGRGGEELQFLRAHAIDFEVVPGITAALACAAYAGVPLTHREHAQSVRLMTAHGKDARVEPDWATLASPGQTLAVYMGVAGLAHLSTQLVAHGRSADTPCVLIENGSRPDQRVIRTHLQALSTHAREHQVQSPALLIVGEVAALSDDLHWFGSAPLTSSGAEIRIDLAA